jgi:hypothetical protein
MVTIPTILAAAGLLSGVTAIDLESICREFPPARNECAIISYVNNEGDPKALLLNRACASLIEKDWDPQNPGLKTNLRLPGAAGDVMGDIVATTSYVGADDVAAISVTVDGKSPQTFDRGTQSVSEGITVTWYRQLNFHSGY